MDLEKTQYSKSPCFCVLQSNELPYQKKAAVFTYINVVNINLILFNPDIDN